MAHEETDRIKTAYRKWLVRLIFEWSWSQALLAYCIFLFVGVLMLAHNHDLNTFHDKPGADSDAGFLLGIGPLWMLFCLIVGSRLIAEFQLAIIKSMKQPNEMALAFGREIEAAIENCFYSKWVK
jgi:hypothetical protein